MQYWKPSNQKCPLNDKDIRKVTPSLSHYKFFPHLEDILYYCKRLLTSAFIALSTRLALYQPLAPTKPLWLWDVFMKMETFHDWLYLPSHQRLYYPTMVCKSCLTRISCNPRLMISLVHVKTARAFGDKKDDTRKWHQIHKEISHVYVYQCWK